MNDGGSPFDEGRFRYVKLGEPDPEEPQRSVAPPGGSPVSSTRSRRSKLIDRTVGILLGLVLGIGIVTAYVFLGSEETIDAPRIQDESSRTEQGPNQSGQGNPNGQP